MSKMSKAIAVLGVVAGLGVAALPLSSYAADYSQSTNATIQVEVGGAISISTSVKGTAGSIIDLGDLKINGATASVDETNVTADGNGTMAVVVNSNDKTAGYDLSIKAGANGPDMKIAGGADTIPAVVTAGANAVKAGTSAWGYRLIDNGAWGNWTGVTTTGTPIAENQNTAQTGGTGDFKNETLINFGASADSSQAPGTYTATVVFTATVK